VAVVVEVVLVVPLQEVLLVNLMEKLVKEIQRQKSKPQIA
jgi:hypothetical protein